MLLRQFLFQTGKKARRRARGVDVLAAASRIRPEDWPSFLGRHARTGHSQTGCLGAILLTRAGSGLIAKSASSVCTQSPTNLAGASALESVRAWSTRRDGWQDPERVRSFRACPA